MFNPILFDMAIRGVYSSYRTKGLDLTVFKSPIDCMKHSSIWDFQEFTVLAGQYCKYVMNFQVFPSNCWFPDTYLVAEATLYLKKGSKVQRACIVKTRASLEMCKSIVV